MLAQSAQPLTDIHCHLIPGIDDGSRSWRETLAMARMAVADGIGTVLATPHQLGTFPQNRGERVRLATQQLVDFLHNHDVPLRVLPGADVRIESELVSEIQAGEVLSLADHRKHVLLELPHELYFPLQPVLDELADAGMSGILSHPERNHRLLAQPHIISHLVDEGCLMQITAGSIVGAFGPASQQLAVWMLQRGLVHFVATDAHGSRSRRPLLRRAMARVEKLVGLDTAREVFCDSPADVAAGRRVASGKRSHTGLAIRRWFSRALAG